MKTLLVILSLFVTVLTYSQVTEFEDSTLVVNIDANEDIPAFIFTLNKAFYAAHEYLIEKHSNAKEINYYFNFMIGPSVKQRIDIAKITIDGVDLPLDDNLFRIKLFIALYEAVLDIENYPSYRMFFSLPIKFVL